MIRKNECTIFIQHLISIQAVSEFEEIAKTVNLTEKGKPYKIASFNFKQLESEIYLRF